MVTFAADNFGFAWTIALLIQPGEHIWPGLRLFRYPCAICRGVGLAAKNGPPGTVYMHGDHIEEMGMRDITLMLHRVAKPTTFSLRN